MDNIVDLEIDKIERIINKIENDPEEILTKSIELNLWNNILQAAINGRRLGISLIGHADMLAMLGMSYGSKESNELLTNIHKEVAETAYAESVRLAQIRGAFPAYDSDLDGGPFLDRIGYAKKARRNISLLTIPPSGTLSILLDNQSSGIEPVFALWYTRKRKVTNQEEFDFVDSTGDKFKSFSVFHPNFIKWAGTKGISKEELEANPEKYAKESPYNGCTSEEIDPIDKIKMQGLIQQYVDHSISSTINLKEEATLEDVENIYMEAWKKGLKGVTIYRAGSRSGILNTKTEESVEFDTHDAPKRPRELMCDIYHPSINGERYIVMVGLMNNKPYEVFALKKDKTVKINDSLFKPVGDAIVSVSMPKITVPHSITKGIIRKQKSKHWVLLDDSKGILVENILEQFEIPENEFATKMISTALRHGTAIDYIVDQLNDTDGLITDYAKVIARQLKKYTNGLSKKIKNKVCPSCGQEMRVEGGCSTCLNPDCGYSACG